ncbi:mitogen-activated protein kinase organizer 1 [Cryptococcus wingfieldii CBS 7118]|uniref:Mitogen-activated protein kinase organizer 1 n=1 Tax=Cryptococcus wingfieldii CBS 7118 TaxID=1295528 RepID=A0A1E3J4R1_9TREE|nr:mitogen-activated protein kinase organizer 1 [Cryptococcus wingfieldii CBS 7118]ODN95827.1 mitogen-activated protein kinase organizer 1 [Cryptococcus wingfieldii CBS 7118]
MSVASLAGPSTDKAPNLLSYPKKLVQTLEHQGAVNVVKYNHGAKYLLTGSADRTIRLWNPALGKEIKCYRGHAQPVLALDIAQDNAKFASSGVDKAVFLWDVPSGAVTRRLQGHFGHINAVAFSQDGQVLASAGFDAKVMLWDMRAASRDPLQTLKEATSTITSLILPTSPQVITGSADGFIRTYDLRFGLLTEDLIGTPISSLKLSPTAPEESVLVGTNDGKMRVFDRKDGGCLQTFEGHNVGGKTGKWGTEWGYGDGLVLAGDADGKLWAYNVLDARPIDTSPTPIHKKTITNIQLHPKGKEMITASADGTVKVWGH